MPPAPGEEGEGPVSAALARQLARRSEPDGFLPFDRFMDVALYGEGIGYYARSRSPLGPGGDYYTAPQVHPLFARAVAARVAEVGRAVGGWQGFRIVDLGSGDGALLAGIVRALSERGEGGGAEAVVVDRTGSRRAEAGRAVASAASAAGVAARTVGSLAELGPVRGVVLAHELLDAQPARRLRWDGSTWKELGVRMDRGRLVPAERPLSGLASAGLPDPPGPNEGELVVERSPAALALVREVADHLAEGLCVLVDYGAEGTALRAGHPRGTLAAVRRHRPAGSAVETPGEVDLSTFVDFTQVRAAAAAAGLVELSYRSQAEALAGWGLAADLERLENAMPSSEDKVRLRLAAKNLLFGFDTFRVLELSAPASADALGAVSGPSRASS